MSEQNEDQIQQLIEMGAVVSQKQNTESGQEQYQTDTDSISMKEMEESMENFLEEKTYLSITLDQLSQSDPSTLPKLCPQCAQCPNAVWFFQTQKELTKKELKCYCRVMFLITWSSLEPYQMIQLCDGVVIGQE